MGFAPGEHVSWPCSGARYYVHKVESGGRGNRTPGRTDVEPSAAPSYPRCTPGRNVGALLAPRSGRDLPEAEASVFFLWFLLCKSIATGADLFEEPLLPQAIQGDDCPTFRPFGYTFSASRHTLVFWARPRAEPASLSSLAGRALFLGVGRYLDWGSALSTRLAKPGAMRLPSFASPS